MQTKTTVIRQALRPLAAVLLVTAGSHAMAESCTPYIANLFNWLNDGSATGYYVQATRVTARGGGGFSSFSMDKSYAPSMGISTSPAPRDRFVLQRDATGALSGQFQDVFPGRTDGASDLTTLRIRAPSTVQLRFDDWGGSLTNLKYLQCFPGDTGRSFVMSGTGLSWGSDIWSLVFVPTS